MRPAKRRKAGPRQRFECVFCGIRIEGKLYPDGRVMPYNRSATDWSIPVHPCVCVHCQQNAPVDPKPFGRKVSP